MSGAAWYGTVVRDRGVQLDAVALADVTHLAHR